MLTFADENGDGLPPFLEEASAAPPIIDIGAVELEEIEAFDREGLNTVGFCNEGLCCEKDGISSISISGNSGEVKWVGADCESMLVGPGGDDNDDKGMVLEEFD
jgi:hypothetical protein